MRFSRLAFAAAVLAIGAVTQQNGFAYASDAAAADASPSDAPNEVYKAPEGAEDYEFEAEVHRMLDIVVNSLYQNKDVFLRELISNASDAIDKVRFLGLNNPKMLEDKEDLEIRVEYDDAAKTLTIRDSGIGMTHDDLKSNLGTVARSGTTRFLEAMKDQEKKKDMGNMIGKFGVGFYSTFLVADRVSVASKHPESPDQFVWESINGENSFHIFKDPRGNTLGRGTEITLHLKEEALEYAGNDRLRNLIKHYSEFVTHPIHLRTVSTVEVEVEDEEVEEKKEEGEDDDLEVEEEKEEKPKKTEMVTTYDWEEINSDVAIWTREKDEITDEEYKNFWKVVAKQNSGDALRWNHFNAEGNINFKSLLYLPEDVPDSYRFGNLDKVDGGLKLYVRKVLISDDFDLMPRYLGFVRGVVDSEDLPLNVNRETLQETKIIKVIKKKLVRKVLDTIRALSKEEMPAEEEEEVELDEEGNVVEKAKKPEKEHPYITWYKKFNANLKMGVIDDEPNRSKLVKLLRFQTSKSDGKFVSLDEYVANMKDWQKEIYVLGGISLEEIEKSPFLERFHEKDIEVLYLTDPVDEYLVQQVRDYEKHKFSAISSDNVKINDEDEDMVKRREKAYKNKFKPLTKWLKKLYGPTVMRVAISKRLGSQPAIVSSAEYGHSANMERIMRAQAYQMGQNQMMGAMKVLEINPRHPFITKLLEGCPPEKEEDTEPFVVSKETENAAWLLFDMASLNGGFDIVDKKAHTDRMTKFMQSSLSLESLSLEEEIEPPEEDEEAPDVDMDDVMAGMQGMNMDDFDMDNLDLDM